MAVPWSWLGIVMVVWGIQEASGALQCFQCISILNKGKSYAVSGVETDDGCEPGSITTFITVNSGCCVKGQVCGAIQGEATLDGDVSVSVTVRSCMTRANENIMCEDDDGVAALSLEAAVPGAVVKTSTQCYCDSNFCSPVTCPKDYVKMFEYCLHYGYIIAMIVIGVALLSLVTGCCCCCFCGCRCCKSKRS